MDSVFGTMIRQAVFNIYFNQHICFNDEYCAIQIAVFLSIYLLCAYGNSKLNFYRYIGQYYIIIIYVYLNMI